MILERTAQSIFLAAIDDHRPDEWPAFLDAACAGDQALRASVEKLLRSHRALGTFHEGPPVCAATLDAPDAAIGTQIGPYKLLELIGEGGMGLVYLAEQQQPVTRLVALKIIKPGLDSRQVIARFEAERQALAMMDHPGIARILEAGTVGGLGLESSAREETRSDSELPSLSLPTSPSPSSGRPYFVMELVRGLPITEFCDHKQLTIRQRLELFIQVCQAVQHAHQKGIIHRDLKPTNVLVTMADAVAVPKIIDFGIAKALQIRSQESGDRSQDTLARSASEGNPVRLTEQTLHTGIAQLIGTPLYMSPEQAEMNSLDVDTRSDVYSLGVLLYELLTGTTPFDKDRLKSAGFDEMRRIIREEEPETVSRRLTRTRGEMRNAECGVRNGGNETGLRRFFTPHFELRTPHLAELDWIVAKSLEKDRARRYESASALAADIERYLADEPVLACPPSLAYRWSKVFRRHKAAAATVAIIAFTTLGSAAFSAHKYMGERAARRDADAQKVVALQNAKKAGDRALEATLERGNAVRQKAEAERQRDAARQNLFYADMRLAAVDVETGNANRALDRILSHIPQPDEADHRGWEWYYLLGRSHEAQQVLSGHTRPVYEVAWSPDGRHIASVSADGSLQVWSTRNWQLVANLQFGSSVKRCVAWSRDSKKLSWGGTDAVIRIWDCQSGEISSLKGKLSTLALGWSNDGKRLAVGSWGDIEIWDVEACKSLFRIESGGTFTSVGFDITGQLLAIEGMYGSAASLWDIGVPVGQAPKRVDLKAHLPAATCACWHSSDPRLAVANSRGECLIWNSDTRENQFRWQAHPVGISTVRWSPDGKHLLTASDDGVISIWSVPEHQPAGPAAGSPIERLALSDPFLPTRSWQAHTGGSSWQAHAGGIFKAEWSANGSYILSTGGDGLIKAWRLTNAATPEALLTHAAGSTLHADSGFRTAATIAWDPTGRQFVSAGQHGELNIFRVDRPPRPLRIDTQTRNEGGDSVNLAWDRQSTCVFLDSGAKRLIFAWSAATGELLEEFALPEPDGKWRVASFRHQIISDWNKQWPLPDKTTRLIKIPSAGLLDDLVPPSGLNTGWWSLHQVVSPDGTRIAHTCPRNYGTSPATTIRDLKSGQEIDCPAVHTPFGLAWSPNSAQLAVIGSDGVHLFATSSGERTAILPMGNSAVAWSHDGGRIAAGARDGNCEVWDVATRTRLVSERIHTSTVSDISWSPDDCRIASGGANQQTLVWDAATGQQLIALEPHDAGIRHLAWSPDGRKLAAVSSDGVLKIWDASDGYDLPRRDFWQALVAPRRAAQLKRMRAAQTPSTATTKP